MLDREAKGRPAREHLIVDPQGQNFAAHDGLAVRVRLDQAAIASHQAGNRLSTHAAECPQGPGIGIQGIERARILLQGRQRQRRELHRQTDLSLDRRRRAQRRH